MRSNEIYPKSSFLMCLTLLKKVEGTAPDTWNYKVISSNWKKCNGKEFRNSLEEERMNGINHSIQIVSEKPEKFIINQIYMLPTRDRVWVWVED